MKTLFTLGVLAPLLLSAVTWHGFDSPTRIASPAQQTENEPPGQVAASQPESWDAASVRTAIDAGYRTWGDARIAYDKEAMQAMVVPEFYIQLLDQRISGQEFIDTASRPNPRAPLTRFDVEILSVQRSGDDWRLVIAEKVEWTPADAEDRAPGLYSLWITRDGWRRENGKWLVTYSEEIGHENWRGRRPPFEDW
ncbi:MAG: nuclear transport factor 2 family protein [Planctomycetota bacterium]|jgi:hypothetical protein